MAEFGSLQKRSFVRRRVEVLYFFLMLAVAAFAVPTLPAAVPSDPLVNVEGFPQGYQQQNLDPAFGRYPNQGFPQGYQQQNLDPAFGRYPNQGFQNGPGNFGQPGFGQEGFGQGGFPGQGGYGNIAGSHRGGYKEHGY
ncbi:hypothetical protein KGM_210442 [Danaus plexippus plexippus]|uniref:Uncharacterized protein n=1 Tax=Danaus plexippus plexippus TaxID=278856 RepID=A0A212FCZ2_DANPL|nr:hypothetical protein KGM_210442 [Danaus plexippus plexippus]